MNEWAGSRRIKLMSELGLELFWYPLQSFIMHAPYCPGAPGPIPRIVKF